MNKKEIVKAITREVCAYVTRLGYVIEDDGFHGSITFQMPGKTMDHSIEWNRSYQDATTYNWADDETKMHAEAINAYMEPIIAYWNLQYVDKRKRVVA